MQTSRYRSALPRQSSIFVPRKPHPISKCFNQKQLTRVRSKFTGRALGEMARRGVVHKVSQDFSGGEVGARADDSVGEVAFHAISLEPLPPEAKPGNRPSRYG